jgi:SpoVK/Ycf46/Vps4 family AAA+-type ATPase
MATAQQIKSLLQSHYKNDDERFTSIALQVAAHEARKGNLAIAKDIKSLVDKSKSGGYKIIKLNRDVSDLVLVFHPENRFSELILSNEVRSRLLRIIAEYKQRDKIQKFGLHNRRKVLLSGIPGTGKTITASAIAGELQLPLYVIMMDKLMTKYMGETAAKLRDVFNMMQSNKGVYLFDEFDAIGAERARDNEVGEMRRVLNAFLQFLEQDTSDSIILGATNNIKILDSALFRRFDDIITYSIPNSEEIQKLLQLKLSAFLGKFSLDQIIREAKGLSHAEITNACNDALKEIILNDKKTITESLLIQMIQDRKMNYL